MSGGHSFDNSGPPEEASFDLTAMIDVILLLIVFFMLTAQFTRSEQSAVNLPVERGDPGSREEPAVLIIELARNGRASLLGSEVAPDQVAGLVRQHAATPGAAPTLDVLIRADRECPAAALNALCASLASVGLRSVKLATSNDEPQSPAAGVP